MILYKIYSKPVMRKDQVMMFWIWCRVGIGAEAWGRSNPIIKPISQPTTNNSCLPYRIKNSKGALIFSSVRTSNKLGFILITQLLSQFN